MLADRLTPAELVPLPIQSSLKTIFLRIARILRPTVGYIDRKKLFGMLSFITYFKIIKFREYVTHQQVGHIP